MRLLWANSSFLHPTNRGGQIRTLETLRQLHKRHHIDYVALSDPQQPEGPQRAGEYSTQAFAVPFAGVSKQSPRFALQLAGNVASRLPLAIGRWRSGELASTIERLQSEHRYDAMVCDFLVTAVNFPRLERAVLFQHNVESVIWKRHAENSSGMKRVFFQMQYRRMLEFEARVCRSAGGVIAVSEQDAQTMRAQFGVKATAVPTGVDVDYFRPAENPAPRSGLVFVGSMDWMPNIDGVLWFSREVLPKIRAQRPELEVTIVGRTPPAEIQALAAADRFFKVTGTVSDVRPYLWQAAASIVPLRIGGGTRLKIYEAMAAGTPVISTTVGAEGLTATHGETIILADDPEAFARSCVDLVNASAYQERLRKAALAMVTAQFSWEQAASAFERLIDLKSRAGAL